MESSQCGSMCKGTSLLQKEEKRSQVHMESTVGTRRRAEVCMGSTLLKSSRIFYLSEEAFEPLSMFVWEE